MKPSTWLREFGHPWKDNEEENKASSPQSTKKAVEYVIDQLLPAGCLLHRYNAYSTNSIYLKVDAGVACSIRFADHIGKAHLSYRFNFMVQEPGTGVEIDNSGKHERRYYQSEAIDQLVEDVLALRQSRQIQYPHYDLLVRRSEKEGREQKGFWQHAYCVNEYIKKRAHAGGHQT
jgi:hypothetical protein